MNYYYKFFISKSRNMERKKSTGFEREPFAIFTGDILNIYFSKYLKSKEMFFFLEKIEARNGNDTLDELIFFSEISIMTKTTRITHLSTRSTTLCCTETQGRKLTKSSTYSL